MNVACSVLWGGSRSTRPWVFLRKVAAAGDERYLVCAAVAAGVVLVPPLWSATSACSCVDSSMCFYRFLNLWLQIVLEWLHDCCHDSSKRIVMASSRLLGAAAACVILFSFAAGSRK